MLSSQREDLDKTIFHLTESILFPPQSWLEDGARFFGTLFLLASVLVKRSIVFKLPEDAISAAKHLRHLRDQPHQTLGFTRHQVTGLLVNALAFQVESKAGNTMQNLGEMADLCRELLTLDMPNFNTTRCFFLFMKALLPKIRPGVPDQPLDPLIECLRVAREHQLYLYGATPYVLGLCLITRYSMTFVDDDYEEAATILDGIITSSLPGMYVARAQQAVTVLALIRSNSHRTPEYSEEAIYRVRSMLDSSSVEQSPVAFDLDGAANARFMSFCRSEHDGARYRMIPEFLNLPLSQLTGMSSGEDRDSEFSRAIKRWRLLKDILFGILSNDITEIDEAVEKGRTLLPSSLPSTDSNPNPSSLLILSTFGMILLRAFIRATKVEYLNESISTLRQTERQVSEFPLLVPLHLTILSQLFLSLFIRFKIYSRSLPDLDEALEILSQCVNNKHQVIPDRCMHACRWASIAREYQHPSLSTAYESALSLMQDSLLFAPTVQMQHATLVFTDEYHRMPLDYASYHVDLHQLEEAVVTLERGRALLWSEMRHLRASTDQLLQADPQLGQKLTAVNRGLEELTKSIPPSLNLDTDGHAADDLRAVDPFGRLLVKQRKLLKERDDLISQAQALPGFHSFLKSPSFDTLRSAASTGPVIIINHSKWRSDILILLHDTPPSLVPTPDDFFGRASALKNELLDARNKHGPDSYPYNQALAHVLTELYKLVGEPVIDRLHQLNVPEQSRVWWCPTSDLCSLPLHAMGPIPSDDGEERYFLDIYISSYTPTLSALIPASDRSEPGSSTVDLPSLLLVAHFDVPSPDVSLSEVCKDVKIVQALNTRLSVKSLISEGATTTSVLDGLRDHRFVHFVCHGTLEAKKPFDAGFELHGNERLTLLDIVRSHLPAAEFAFLAACHTAELTEGSAADEGLHLAAAVQYCGFRSVVGTMWAMANEDGPVVAKHFYQSMFPKSEQGEPVPYYKRSAGALRDAVKKLRKKRGITLERWVNFVHYGE
jgi:hypothetical protein